MGAVIKGQYQIVPTGASPVAVLLETKIHPVLIRSNSKISFAAISKFCSFFNNKEEEWTNVFPVPVNFNRTISPMGLGVMV